MDCTTINGTELMYVTFVMEKTQHSRYSFYVYTWKRSDGEILYIGQTSNIHARLLNHALINKKVPLLESDQIILESHPNKASALKRERELIFQLQPKLNVQFKKPRIWPKKSIRKTVLDKLRDGTLCKETL